MANTRHRTIRVPDTLWDAAKAKAEDEGTDLSSVIRARLEEYVTTPTPRADRRAGTAAEFMTPPRF